MYKRSLNLLICNKFNYIMKLNRIAVKNLDEIREGGSVDKDSQESKKKCNWRYWSVRLVIVAILVVLIVLIIVFNKQVSETTQDFLEWLGENPAIGTVCLALIYIVATLFFIPGSLLTLGAGVALN